MVFYSLFDLEIKSYVVKRQGLFCIPDIDTVWDNSLKPVVSLEELVAKKSNTLHPDPNLLET